MPDDSKFIKLAVDKSEEIGRGAVAQLVKRPSKVAVQLYSNRVTWVRFPALRHWSWGKIHREI